MAERSFARAPIITLFRSIKTGRNSLPLFTGRGADDANIDSSALFCTNVVSIWRYLPISLSGTGRTRRSSKRGARKAIIINNVNNSQNNANTLNGNAFIKMRNVFQQSLTDIMFNIQPIFILHIPDHRPTSANNRVRAMF